MPGSTSESGMFTASSAALQRARRWVTVYSIDISCEWKQMVKRLHFAIKPHQNHNYAVVGVAETSTVSEVRSLQHSNRSTPNCVTHLLAAWLWKPQLCKFETLLNVLFKAELWNQLSYCHEMWLHTYINGWALFVWHSNQRFSIKRTATIGAGTWAQPDSLKSSKRVKDWAQDDR